MLLTLVEILIPLILAALLGLFLGWLLRSKGSNEAQELVALRHQLRECKKDQRESEKEAA